MHHPPSKPRFARGAYGLLRIGVGLEVLALTWYLATNLSEAALSLTAGGFPAPHLGLLAAIGAGLAGGLALLLGVRVRLAVAALGVLFLPATSVLLALYTGNAWGEWQWLLQLGRLAEVPLLMGFFVWALAAGPGAFSLEGLRARRQARRTSEAARAERLASPEAPPADGRPAYMDRERHRPEQKTERRPRAATLAPCCA